MKSPFFMVRDGPAAPPRMRRLDSGLMPGNSKRRDPNSATPTTLPVCLAELSTAAAMPEFAFGTGSAAQMPSTARAQISMAASGAMAHEQALRRLDRAGAAYWRGCWCGFGKPLLQDELDRTGRRKPGPYHHGGRPAWPSGKIGLDNMISFAGLDTTQNSQVLNPAVAVA
jgi:hypothetical protein